MTDRDQLLEQRILACPLCHAESLDWPEEGPARCTSCTAAFPLRDGSPLLLTEELLATASNGWDRVSDHYSTFEPACGFPLIDDPLVDSCEGDVLEVGCGNGRLMHQVQGRCRSLVGIDPAPAMTAAARAAGFQALTAAAENLPFRPGSFDQVISGWVSMRYTDQVASFREVARVLRPGGSFTFSLWNHHLIKLNGRLASWRRGRTAPAEILENVNDRDVSSIKRLKGKLATAGLPVERILSTPYPDRLGKIMRPVIRYYHGNLGARLGYNVILSCRRSDILEEDRG